MGNLTGKSQVLKSFENDDELDLHALSEFLSLKSPIEIRNGSTEGIDYYVKISKACGEGQDGYWEIKPGKTERWMRCVYHRVTMKLATFADDAGIIDSYDHIVKYNGHCNTFDVGSGKFKYTGPPGSCV